MKKIAIGADHAGFERKVSVGQHLTAIGYSVLDVGTHSPDSVDYPEFGHLVANAIESGQAEMGITLCGSGNGIAIAANKHPGIRAALCWTPEIAALARRHNNANVLSIP
ncbi:MAG: RpiB/LacA/LacB family sugar-phosphate isomerase, partial [Saprospiraceae bacterium]|nr:RpiB/LacA/LacB family sugar-phosphate isomerase [Saprospiraceae bacterium]